MRYETEARNVKTGDKLGAFEVKEVTFENGDVCIVWAIPGTSETYKSWVPQSKTVALDLIL